MAHNEICFTIKEFCDDFESNKSLLKALKNKTFRARNVPKYQYVIQEVLGAKFDFLIPWNSSVEAKNEAKSLRKAFDAIDNQIIKNRNKFYIFQFTY